MAFAGDPPQPAEAAAAGEVLHPLHRLNQKAVTNNASVSPGTNQASAAAATQEDLGYDIFNGKTNKIASIFKEDPVSIWVILKDAAAPARSRVKISTRNLRPDFLTTQKAADAFLKRQRRKRLATRRSGRSLPRDSRLP